MERGRGVRHIPARSTVDEEIRELREELRRERRGRRDADVGSRERDREEMVERADPTRFPDERPDFSVCEERPRGRRVTVDEDDTWDNSPENESSHNSHVSSLYGRPHITDVTPVYFMDDLGEEKYVFPLNKCESKEATEPLWREIYAQKYVQENTIRDIYLDYITKGKYRVQTLEGANILPSAWSTFVRPESYIQIAFDSTLPDSGRSPKPPLRPGPRVAYTSGDTYETISPRRSHSAADTDNESTESELATSDTETPPDVVVVPELDRKVVPPVDCEKNKLSFQVKTAQRRTPTRPNGEEETDGTSPKALDASKGPDVGECQRSRITRVMHTEARGQNRIKIYTLPGPENTQLLESVTMTWYHLPLAQLDFGRFTNLCLNIPPLSARLQTLTHKLLTKLWKEKVNHFLGGMFVEPGTVLRADEKEQSDPQSVIFSCVPYFNIQPAAKKSSWSESILFPPRTLMQSYYPYESVRNRDEEQSYRKFGNSSADGIIHVPNLWIMNIGSDVIVTCGHSSINEETVKSIIVATEDIKQLASQDVDNNTLRTIRVIDLQGREFIFPIGDCRSYFQLETRIRELRYCSGWRERDDEIRLQHKTKDGSKELRPGDWGSLIKRTDLISITVSMIDDGKGDEQALTATSSPHQVSGSSSIFVPPFFHWPQSTPKDTASGEKKVKFLGTSDVQQASILLEQADKIMMTESFTDSYNKVATVFSSAAYYRSLPELTFKEITTDFTKLRLRSKRTQPIGSALTFHQSAIENQCTRISEQTTSLFGIVRMTFELFVSDIDQSRILRKGWGAMKQLHDKVTEITLRGSLGPDPKEYTDPEWKHPDMVDRTWHIRTPAKPSHLAVLETDAQLNKVIRRCKRCSIFRSYDSPEAALKHLRKHAKKAADLEESSAIISPGVLDSSDEKRPGHSLPPDSVLKEWVLNSEQFRREETNGDALATLTKAQGIARELFVEASELAEGIQNEDGDISGLYKMPQQELVRAFRNIMVFFMATERAVHYGTEVLRDQELIDYMAERSYFPGSEKEMDEGVVKRLGEVARRSLRRVRFKLCGMVKSDPPLDIFRKKSLGPEYVCAWLMRRLLVKPVNRPGPEPSTGSLKVLQQPQQQPQETIGDLYRGFISKLQFQVNSRASKRLLRDINLLQDELQILIAVNTWQTNLIQNYTRVLDDTSYEQELPSRKSMFPYERDLLRTCLNNLKLARDDFSDLLDLCRPLSDRTKQILEINEEDHGKAIMVFTVVTVIFLPLSFATSYFGMNTSDIRDMDQTQTLFWSVAIPLTVLTVGGCMLIGYNGVELLDGISSFLRMVSGKQKESPDAGVGVSRRKPPPNLQFDTTNTQELTNLDEAEFANPRPSGCDETMEDIQANKDYASIRKKIPYVTYGDDDEWFREEEGALIKAGERRAANFSHERNGLPPLPPRIDIVPGTMGAGWDKQDAWYDMKEKELWQRNRRSHRKVDNNYYENYGRY
ncbi:CorA Mg2+ and Co2+ transporter [Pyrenophora tritici-repentis]|nr:CorA Mg2+ and Co2+ transporter [Pyrenophora tritici-repentis]KAF7449075.1 CorA Mg2+ and Co2+ transporter [Pyrenophora tritici-repentis]KAG9383985.1 CorA Mg2+ and Co2+ transporter [Pyrenophora tritici-repentis]KAI0574403.1 CorA Mg2+ and Co2+ transporter [Pyrenophora tritici-repentis]KAI0577565.1 CorA Mg2+ and Co2+ transporter [Pyrenophora tritici-repentis]